MYFFQTASAVWFFNTHLILPNDIISVDSTVVRPNTDALGRNTGKTIEVGTTKIAEEKISYVKFGDHATNLPSTVRFASNDVFKKNIQYKYNCMGTIVSRIKNILYPDSFCQDIFV